MTKRETFVKCVYGGIKSLLGLENIVVKVFIYFKYLNNLREKKVMKYLKVLSLAGFLALSSAVFAEDEKEFHPTDALLIGGNGGFNPTGDEDSPIKMPGEDGF